MERKISKSQLRRLSIQLDDNIVKCPTCNGTGKVPYGHSYHNIRNKRVCLDCMGKKYIKGEKLV